MSARALARRDANVQREPERAEVAEACVLLERHASTEVQDVLLHAVFNGYLALEAREPSPELWTRWTRSYLPSGCSRPTKLQASQRRLALAIYMYTVSDQSVLVNDVVEQVGLLVTGVKNIYEDLSEADRAKVRFSLQKHLICDSLLMSSVAWVRRRTRRGTSRRRRTRRR